MSTASTTSTASVAPIAATPATAAPSAETLQRVRAVRRHARRRSLRIDGLLAALVLGLFAARVLLGDYTVTIPDFARIVTGADIPTASFIVMESKLPRAVLAVLVGSSLAVAGALFQDMLRNPLASPDILGVTTGASAAAVFAIVALRLSGTGVTIAAALGALAVAALLVGLSLRGGRPDDYTMIIVGVGLAAMLYAVIHWLLLRADIYSAHDAMVWLTGSLAQATWSEIARLAVVAALVLPLTSLLHRDLALVTLGDDLAAGLGVRVTLGRALGMLAIVALVASAAAVAGPVSFVSLLSGPIARRLHRGRTRIPSAALVGCALVLAADYVAAYAIPGTNLPVGVVTGVAGAPFLLWLLIARQNPTKDQG